MAGSRHQASLAVMFGGAEVIGLGRKLAERTIAGRRESPVNVGATCSAPERY